MQVLIPDGCSKFTILTPPRPEATDCYWLGRIITPWFLGGLAAPSAGTSIFAPEDMSDNDIGFDSDNGALTVVLAKCFTGRVGDDLDMGNQC